jgi:hypothetical protein
MSVWRLPQRQQISRSRQSIRAFRRAVPSGHLGGVGFDLMPAILAPHDQPDAGGGSIAERHRLVIFKSHPSMRSPVSILSDERHSNPLRDAQDLASKSWMSVSGRHWGGSHSRGDRPTEVGRELSGAGLGEIPDGHRWDAPPKVRFATTPCWREKDSNPRSSVEDSIFSRRPRKRRKSGSQLTPCWRKMDSNPRSPVYRELAASARPTRPTAPS